MISAIRQAIYKYWAPVAIFSIVHILMLGFVIPTLFSATSDISVFFGLLLLIIYGTMAALNVLSLASIIKEVVENTKE